MNCKKKKWLGLVFCCVYVFSFSGCFALLVGATAGVGGYAYVQGALTKEYDVPAEKLHRAILAGLKDMKLEVSEEKSTRLSARIVAKDVQKITVKVDVNASTEKTSELKIRYGTFGNKMKSEMILNAIEKRL